MAIVIEERFPVAARPEEVFAWLLDPRKVVTCLPGAELTEVADERTYHGVVKVKVGPVTVAYRGTVRLAEVDAAGLRVRMDAEGREVAGAGAARMAMESRVLPAPVGAEISVRAEVDVVGRIVQFGRGMIEQVAHQVFQQFAESVRHTLETGAEAGTAAGRPVRAIPLLFRALLAWVRALLGRLFGRAGR